MSAKVRRNAPSDEPRVRILAAATRLFSQRGFHGTTIPDVSSAANVGAGTIYRAFADKEALYNAVFRAAKEQLRDAIIPVAFGAGSPRERWGQLFRALAGFAATRPEAFQVLELQSHGEVLDAESRALERGVLEPLFAGIAQMQESGALRRGVRPDVMMALVWGGFVGLIKAARDAYLELDATTLAEAEESLWLVIGGADEPHEGERPWKNR
jgi:AcrR family transcriptional regulator